MFTEKHSHISTFCTIVGHCNQLVKLDPFMVSVPDLGHCGSSHALQIPKEIYPLLVLVSNLDELS